MDFLPKWTTINGKDKMDSIKNRILVETKDLLRARKWIEKNL